MLQSAWERVTKFGSPVCFRASLGRPPTLSVLHEDTDFWAQSSSLLSPSVLGLRWGLCLFTWRTSNPSWRLNLNTRCHFFLLFKTAMFALSLNLQTQACSAPRVDGFSNTFIHLSLALLFPLLFFCCNSVALQRERQWLIAAVLKCGSMSNCVKPAHSSLELCRLFFLQRINI